MNTAISLAPSIDTFEKSPSNEGSSKRMRSSNGGWLANNPANAEAPLLKNR